MFPCVCVCVFSCSCVCDETPRRRVQMLPCCVLSVCSGCLHFADILHERSPLIRLACYWSVVTPRDDRFLPMPASHVFSLPLSDRLSPSPSLCFDTPRCVACYLSIERGSGTVLLQGTIFCYHSFCLALPSLSFVVLIVFVLVLIVHGLVLATPCFPFLLIFTTLPLPYHMRPCYMASMLYGLL